MKASKEAKKNIEERLVLAYDRLRNNSKNGLAVVELIYGNKKDPVTEMPLVVDALTKYHPSENSRHCHEEKNHHL